MKTLFRRIATQSLYAVIDYLWEIADGLNDDAWPEEGDGDSEEEGPVEEAGAPRVRIVVNGQVAAEFDAGGTSPYRLVQAGDALFFFCTRTDRLSERGEWGKA